MAEILIVDDEPNVRRMLASLLDAEGFRTREAATGADAVRSVEASEPDAVLLDLMLPGLNGLEALRRMRERRPDLPVVMMSGKATLGDAVEATKLGAFQFIEKPLTPEAVLVTLRSALELRRTRDLNRALRDELRPGEAIVGESRPLEELRALVQRVAPTDARVVITGESGTGKELVASAIHALSPRRDRPFVRVNCAAIPRDLIESEMFGHEKGSFTGATERRRGKFELADTGTLFLDEVADLGPEAQAKLLRAVEAGEIERVGGQDVIPVDARVIAATNKRLEEEVERDRFRDDLYFRLHVFAIHVPPLRERREDVPLLVAHFLERFRARHGLRAPVLTPTAIETLQAYRWPGNVRELANVVERLMILYSDREIGDAEVRSVLLQQPGGGGPALRPDGRSLSRLLDEYERHLIEATLGEADGNVAEAARRLNTDRPNLYRRMKRLGVTRPSESS